MHDDAETASNARRTRAEELYFEALAALPDGVPVDLEALARGHPELGDALHSVVDDWSWLDDLRADNSASGPAGPMLSEAEVRAMLAGTAQDGARYERRGQIGRGGMGLVVRAWDRNLRRTLAMKIADASRAREDPSGGTPASRVHRFLTEAQVTARLEHPGIVPVHDVGLDAEGRLYYTMRLVEGESLSAAIRAASADASGGALRTVVRALASVCDTLAYAHSKGVVHRDLKPSNVMTGRFGEVYVMDWGVARILAEEDLPAEAPTTEAAHAAPLATQVGDVLGTPAYMSPEQARGDPIDARSDVYAIGAMLYHLLAGHPPFSDPARSPESGAIVAAVRAGAPPALAAIAPDAAPELAAICARAMERAAERRYASVEQLGADLVRWLEGRVVSAHRAGPLTPLVKWARRNRAAAWGIGAAAALVVLSAVGYALLEARRNRELSRSVARQRVATYAARVAAASAARELGRVDSARQWLAGCPEDLRSWEWEIVAGRLDGSRAQLEPLASGPITTMDVSADGRLAVTGTMAGELELWDVSDRRRLRALGTLSDFVHCARFHPGGELVAAASFGGEVVVFDVSSGERVWEAYPLSTPTRLAFDAAGERLAIGRSGGRVEIRRPSDGEVLLAFRAHERKCDGLAFDPSGERLSTMGIENAVRIWNPATGERLLSRQLLAYGDRMVHFRDVEFSPDGERLLVAGNYGFVAVLDAATLAEELRLDGHVAHVMRASFDPSGERVLASSRDHTLRVWNARTGALEMLGVGHADWVREAAWLPDGSILSGGEDRRLLLWSADSDGAPARVPLHRQLHDVAVRPDGKAVAIAGACAPVVLDVATGDVLASLPAPEGVSFCNAYSPGGAFLAQGFNRGSLAVWDARTHELLFVEDTGAARITDVAFHPREPLLAWTSLAGEVGLVDLARLAHVRRAILDATALQELAFLDSGEIAVVGDRGRLRILDPETLAPLLTIAAHEGAATTVALAPDGALLATGGRDRAVRLWTPRGELVAELTGHTADVLKVAFSPDGTRLASSGLDTRLLVWDTGARVAVGEFVGHEGWVWGIGFDPSGGWLASVAGDGSLLFWERDPRERGLRRAAATQAGLGDWIAELQREHALPDELLRAVDAHAATPAERLGARWIAATRAVGPWTLSQAALRHLRSPVVGAESYRRALEWTRRASALGPRRPVAVATHGIALLRDDRPEEALEWLHRAAALRAEAGEELSFEERVFEELALVRAEGASDEARARSAALAELPQAGGHVALLEELRAALGE